MPPVQNILEALNTTANPEAMRLLQPQLISSQYKGDLGLPEYIVKCKKSQQHTILDQPMTNVMEYILPKVRNQKVHEKCITVQNLLASEDVIHVALEVYHSYTKLSIKQSMSSSPQQPPQSRMLA